jgi:uncharacterized membrane protein YeaQ/YmgE (transglycosylase-associated protein family)
MAVVRRDESARRQLSIDGSYNVYVTHCITPGPYTFKKRGWLSRESGDAWGGYGLIGNMVVGLIGAYIGGWLAGSLGIGGSSSLIGTIAVAFIGACILLAIIHAVTRGSTRGRLFRQ